MTDDRFLLKDFFNRDSIGVIATAVAGAYAGFDKDTFLAAVFDPEWDDRELKQRMRHVATALRAHLPEDYNQALAILVEAGPAAREAGFAAMVFSDFVEAFGIDHFEASVAALHVFTKNVSAEFAVRPFLVRYPDRMLQQMKEWATDPDPAQRRLASEGTRPRLPWGLALKQYQADPTPIVPLLAGLSHDPSEDVRRSVANSLNDIAKDHPDLVVDLLERWQDGSDEVAGITKHALRVLLKRGHHGALQLLGFHPDPEVVVERLTIASEVVEIGDKAAVSFVVRSTGTEVQSVMIDGLVEYRRPRGTSTKVFKWKTTDLESGDSIRIKRSISLQPMSTRQIHPGPHSVVVQVNGRPLARASFEVKAP